MAQKDQKTQKDLKLKVDTTEIDEATVKVKQLTEAYKDLLDIIEEFRSKKDFDEESEDMEFTVSAETCEDYKDCECCECQGCCDYINNRIDNSKEGQNIDVIGIWYEF